MDTDDSEPMVHRSKYEAYFEVSLKWSEPLINFRINFQVAAQKSQDN